jgi:hypothetical protein
LGGKWDGQDICYQMHALVYASVGMSMLGEDEAQLPSLILELSGLGIHYIEWNMLFGL